MDGSAQSTTALRWASRQAGLTGSGIDAFAFWHRPMTVSACVPVAHDELDLSASTGEATRAAVLGVVAGVPEAAEVDVQIHVAQGHPARVLIGASAGAALLAVGSRGHGELSGMSSGRSGCTARATPPAPW